MQITLTALVTILVGALTLVVGQIIVRGAIEPALELKRLIGTIAHDLDFYACSLTEKLTVIIAYPIFEKIFQLPPENAIREASHRLIGYSNRPAEPPWERLPDAKIKELLRIKT
jgi:hypothetical protein